MSRTGPHQVVSPVHLPGELALLHPANVIDRVVGVQGGEAIGSFVRT
jgi:hypothetical protein